MKIAICFSGLLKYWDFCSNFFERYNDYRDDVQFYFYLSTWKNENVWMFEGGENPRNDGIEMVDLSKYKFLNEYQRIDDLSVKKITKNKKKSNFKEYFARNISGVFELLNRQRIDFDSVVWSRPDHIFTTRGLNTIINITKDLSTNQICGSGKKENIRDYYLIMQPSLTDKFQNIFNDYYIEENVPEPARFSVGNIIEYHNMDYKSIGLGGYLARSNRMTQKKDYPTYEVLNNLAQKNGYDWVFENLFRIRNYV